MYARNLLILSCVAIIGCENGSLHKREMGALGGGAIGAGLGAIIGNQVGSAGAGIAIGSAIGAISGGLIGNELDNTDESLDQRQKRIAQQDRELAENRRLIDELKRRGADARITDRGVVINLPDVLFKFDSAEITSAAQRTCREIVSVVGSRTNRHISVEGHTDSVGTIPYNQRLSEDRAKSVASELMALGVPRHSVSTHGYGESRPVATNRTDEGRSRNRRVEVVIENR